MFAKDDNCTCDEWNSLLRLFIIMNFSMCLSTEKSTIMSERAQERRTEEELVVWKSRSVCLVSRNLSAQQSTTLDSGGLENQELGWDSVSTRGTQSRIQQGILKCGKEILICFQVSGKPVRSGVFAFKHAATYSRDRGLARKKFQNHNAQCSENQDFEVFQKLQQKLNRSENEQMLDLNTKVSIW